MAITMKRELLHRRWDQLTDEDLDNVGEDRARLIVAIAQRYGCSRDDAAHQVSRHEADPGGDVPGEAQQGSDYYDKIAGKPRPRGWTPKS